MTESELLEQVFERLSGADAVREMFGADEVRQWPDGALANLVKGGVLRPAQPAQVIKCDGCERNCFMPVNIRTPEEGRSARAFISCDKREDMGRIPVKLSRLEQWQVTGGTLAGAVARLLGFTKSPQADSGGKHWVLGLLTGKESKGTVTLSIENGATLALTGQSIPLAHVLTLGKNGLIADRDALLRVVEGDTRQPEVGIGSPAWRKQKAKAAAGARHGKPGGSHDMQKQMRAAWASDKYTSRDRCAEEECAALGISYSTARKALRNTPDPKRT